MNALRPSGDATPDTSRSIAAASRPGAGSSRESSPDGDASRSAASTGTSGRAGRFAAGRIGAFEAEGRQPAPQGGGEVVADGQARRGRHPGLPTRPAPLAVARGVEQGLAARPQPARDLRHRRRCDAELAAGARREVDGALDQSPPRRLGPERLGTHDLAEQRLDGPAGRPVDGGEPRLEGPAAVLDAEVGQQQTAEATARRVLRGQPTHRRARVERAGAAENGLRAVVEVRRAERRYEAGALRRPRRPAGDLAGRPAPLGGDEPPARQRPRQLLEVARPVGPLADRPVVEHQLCRPVGHAQPPVPVHADLDHHGGVDDEGREQVRDGAQAPPAEQGVAAVKGVGGVDRAGAAAENPVQEEDQVLP